MINDFNKWDYLRKNNLNEYELTQRILNMDIEESEIKKNEKDNKEIHTITFSYFDGKDYWSITRIYRWGKIDEPRKIYRFFYFNGHQIDFNSWIFSKIFKKFETLYEKFKKEQGKYNL